MRQEHLNLAVRMIQSFRNNRKPIMINNTQPIIHKNIRGEYLELIEACQKSQNLKNDPRVLEEVPDIIVYYIQLNMIQGDFSLECIERILARANIDHDINGIYDVDLETTDNETIFLWALKIAFDCGYDPMVLVIVKLFCDMGIRFPESDSEDFDTYYAAVKEKAKAMKYKTAILYPILTNSFLSARFVQLANELYGQADNPIYEVKATIVEAKSLAL